MKRIRSNPPTPQLKVVWSPDDSAIVLREFDRHAAEAIALTREGIEAAKAVHPATLSKQLNGDLAPENPRPCTVIDLFTRDRLS